MAASTQCGRCDVSQELKQWVATEFDAPLQEAYGRTEVDSVAGTCTALGAVREGTIGKVTPGRAVGIVDPDAPPTPVEMGTVGEFAVRRDEDPVCFFESLNEPGKTERKLAAVRWSTSATRSRTAGSSVTAGVLELLISVLGACSV
nr:hypothetical protein [Halorientalis regularis]